MSGTVFFHHKLFIVVFITYVRTKRSYTHYLVEWFVLLVFFFALFRCCHKVKRLITLNIFFCSDELVSHNRFRLSERILRNLLRILARCLFFSICAGISNWSQLALKCLRCNNYKLTSVGSFRFVRFSFFHSFFSWHAISFLVETIDF